MNQARETLFTRHELDNGLVLLAAENPRLPLVSISAFVKAGVDQNPPHLPGLAALTSRLLDEGTQRHDALQISELVENAGGSVSTFCERELCGVSLSLMAGHLESGLGLLAEMVMSPTFPPDRLELERARVLNQLSAMADDPQTVASQRLHRWIYPNSPLGFPTLGTRETVETLQVDELKEFYRQKFSPTNTLLVVVGAFDGPGLRALVIDRFSTWENRSCSLQEIPPPRRQVAPIQDEFFMDKTQLTILLGHLGIRRTNPDYHALQVMDIVLGSGSGFTSRIPMRLRDEQGLAYSVYSSITSSCGLHPGLFLAAITTSPENRVRVIEGLLGEIRKLIEHGISRQELKTAQDYLTGSFVFEFQSSANLVQFLLATELFHLGRDYPKEYPSLIRKISREDVHRVATQYLDTINYTAVVVGPIHDSNPRNP